MSDGDYSNKVKAVLLEIKQALCQLADIGKEETIFIDKMALSFEERRAIRNFLGEGLISIKFADRAEPAEWLESGISGVWYGVFYNASNNPVLETIEIASYPKLAMTPQEDIRQSIDDFTKQLSL